MLYNIPLNIGTAAVAVSSAIHETITIPAGGGTSSATKAGYSRASGHYNGLIINSSGLSETGETVFFMAVAQGQTAPTRDSVLSGGIPLTPGGSILEIPEKAALDFYFASQGAVSIQIKAIYFIRS